MTTNRPTLKAPIASPPTIDNTDTSSDTSGDTNGDTSSDIEIVDVRATDAEATSTVNDDEVRQKFAELIDAIERRAKIEAGNVSDWREQAVEKAKETVEKAKETIGQTEQFARKRQTQIGDSVKTLQDETFDHWTSLTQEAEDFTNRLQKAANKAWKIVMKKEEEAKAADAAKAKADMKTEDKDDKTDTNNVNGSGGTSSTV